MFERFTERARQVVVLAQEEARLLNHNYIGTEHILLGLVVDGEGIAARALDALGIRLDAVRHEVEQIIGIGQQAPSGHIPFTPRAKKVLELSLREALQLGCNYIGTEHILLGLIREGEGVAAQVLKRLGADLKAVRRQVTAMAPGRDPDMPETAGARSGVVPGSILATLRDITDRLTRIEEHLGISRRVDPTGDIPRDITDRLTRIEDHLGISRRTEPTGDIPPGAGAGAGAGAEAAGGGLEAGAEAASGGGETAVGGGETAVGGGEAAGGGLEAAVGGGEASGGREPQPAAGSADPDDPATDGEQEQA